nr:nadh-ubiquinone oxidoreductase 17.8 kda subunit, mitochondrial [Quercus suber]
MISVYVPYICLDVLKRHDCSGSLDGITRRRMNLSDTSFYPTSAQRPNFHHWVLHHHAVYSEDGPQISLSAEAPSSPSGFYVTLAALPLSVAAYRFTSGGEDLPYFTRKITDTYESYAKKWADRNDLHTQAVEQAGNDRVLMIGETDRKARTVDLKFPEQFNGGCPWNVPAGQGHINLDNVIAKYEKEAFEANEKKLEQLRTNTVPAEHPFKPLAKDTPAVVSA